MIRRLSDVSHVRFYSALVFSQFGDPSEVLSLQEYPDKDVELNPYDLRLRMLAASVNPSDLNTIEGVYPLQPPDPDWKLPAVAGHEGVGEVLETGSKVSEFRPGDWAVPLVSHQGTWRERGVFQSHFWHKISNSIPVHAAATLAINPSTALCLLREFVDLKKGDVIIQNGATSAVGQSIIQLARVKGIHTFNIIRDRFCMYFLTLFGVHLGLGLTKRKSIYCLWEQPLLKEKKLQWTALSGLPLGSLGLNCIGGKEVILVSKLLKNGAVLVTYGGMSKKPLTIPTSLFVFKDLTLRGFWWSGNTSGRIGVDVKKSIIDEISHYIQSGQLKIKIEAFTLGDYKEALHRQGESYRVSKIILTL